MDLLCVKGLSNFYFCFQKLGRVFPLAEEVKKKLKEKYAIEEAEHQAFLVLCFKSLDYATRSLSQ